MLINGNVADVQNTLDARDCPVNRVGIRGLRHPFFFEDIGLPAPCRQSVVGRFDMLVDLPKDQKGTHMSRFVEILNQSQVNISIAALPKWVSHMVERLGAKDGFLITQFPIFVQKWAPVSKIASLMDYEVILQGTLLNGKSETLVTVIVPVTSLCPCSKEIADYGAHNQRSHVTVTVKAVAGLSVVDIIKLVESKASCDLYGILKRTDEKAITERAYDNPKFVEDMVRDVANGLDKLRGVKGYKIASENFESIHNHSAFAEIDRLNTTITSEIQPKNLVAELT